MKKTNPADDTEEIDHSFFRSLCHVVYPNDSDEIYSDMIAKVMERFAEYQKNGSGWSLKSLDSLLVIVGEYKPMGESSFIPLPAKLRGKKVLINMKNDDQECFKWAVTRALNPVERGSERITKTLREQSKQYNWEGISFPTPLSEIKKFERNNNVSISVVANDIEDGDRVYPRKSSNVAFETKIILMLLRYSMLNNHYVVVKNLSRLLQGQATNKHAKRHYCSNCFNGFTCEARLAEHMEYCSTKDCVKTFLPSPTNNTLKFKNFKNTRRHPFTIYVDFECFTVPVEDSSTAFTTKYQEHKPSGYCFYVKCSVDDVYDMSPVIHTREREDEDVTKHFVSTLTKTVREISELFNNKPFLKSTREQGKHCHVCNVPFNKDEERVFDKCMLTQESLGVSHKSCACKPPKFIPVIFHNLEGYDSHLFIKALAEVGDISVISKNEERYISFSSTIDVGEYINSDGKVVTTKQEIRFLDSFKFMSSGLAKLVDDLDKETDVRVRNKFYKGQSLDLLLRKGVYPKTTEWDKDNTLVNETINLPRKIMKAIVLLFKSKTPSGSEEYVYPKIKSVKVTIEGVPNSVYSQGIPKSRFKEEAQRLFGRYCDPERGISTREFYKDQFACVIDLRTHDDNFATGTGKKLVNTQSGVLLENNKLAMLANVMCKMFVISDGLLNISNKNLESVQY